MGRASGLGTALQHSLPPGPPAPALSYLPVPFQERGAAPCGAARSRGRGRRGPLRGPVREPRQLPCPLPGNGPGALAALRTLKVLGRPLGHFLYFPFCGFQRIRLRNIFQRVLGAILGFMGADTQGHEPVHMKCLCFLYPQKDTQYIHSPILKRNLTYTHQKQK